MAGAFILRLAQALVAAGHELLVLAPSAPGLAPSAEIDGVSVHRYRYAPSSWETLAYTGTMAEQALGSATGLLALTGMMLGGTLALRRDVASFAPDVIHAHWWFPSGMFTLGAGGKTPVITTLHGSDVRLARNGRVAPSLFRRVAARSFAVTAVSTWLATESEAMAPGLEVRVLQMPADTTLFVPPAAEHAERADRFVFVGRLNAQKGVDRLLRAMATVRTESQLDIVGDGPDRQSLEKLAASLGIANRVSWHGMLPQQQLVPIVQTAIALVVPSENEGLGLVAVEALLCETPVIAFRSGGLADVIEDGVTGTLVPPGSIDQLATAMAALRARPDRGAALGKAGRAAMLRRFAPEPVAAQFSDLYAAAVRGA